ncbi:MAG: preprotein translocase subunit SecY [Ruminococcaceae bacterium]|nr:preprotein translocase subunit SecY [Oscillospiraceae bacterium]
MFKTLANAWKLPDLRKKMIYTVVMLLIFRLGCVLPVPYVDSEAIASWFDSSTSGTMLSFFNILSGSSFSQATLFALSVTPYITASIVMQLLAIAIPALERLSKEGEEGKKKITQITRYVTVALALLTSYGYYMTLRNNGLLADRSFFAGLVIVACHCAGAALIMWMGEKINEKGIGNGISMILFANIISSMPSMIFSIGAGISGGITMAALYIGIVVLLVVMVGFIVFMTNSERRIPVQYAKKVVGRKMYGGQSTFLPIKLDMAGVMPVIFANSILMLPSTIAMFFPAPAEGSFWYGFLQLFSVSSIWYALILLVLIVAFNYFYLSISFNPVEVANNLQKNGGFIPGVRPGRPTSDFIKRSMKKVTLIGAFFLALVAILPMAVNSFGISLGAFSFGGTSMLILCGVILETTRQLESQITMRHYKGFLD